MSFLRCKSVSLPSFIFVFCLDDITKVCRWEICPNHEDANPITHTRKKKKKKKFQLCRFVHGRADFPYINSTRFVFIFTTNFFLSHLEKGTKQAGLIKE
jgi:hypothetical protein